MRYKMWDWIPMIVAMAVLACVRISDPHRATLMYYSERHTHIYMAMRGAEVILLAASVYPMKALIRKQLARVYKAMST